MTETRLDSWSKPSVVTVVGLLATSRNSSRSTSGPTATGRMYGLYGVKLDLTVFASMYVG